MTTHVAAEIAASTLEEVQGDSDNPADLISEETVADDTVLNRLFGRKANKDGDDDADGESKKVCNRVRAITRMSACNFFPLKSIERLLSSPD